MSTKNKLKVLFLAASLASIGLIIPIVVSSQIADIILVPVAHETNWRHSTTQAQDEWINNLGSCESGNNQNAINPEDLDGTASYGRFQFKPGTWKHYITKYDLFERDGWEEADWTNAMMAGDLQEIVLTHMIYDSKVNFAREFPACVRKYGWPPKA